MANVSSITRSRLATKADFRVCMGVFAIFTIGGVGFMQADSGVDARPIDAPASSTDARPIDATASLAGGVTIRSEEASHRPSLDLRGPRFGTPPAPKKKAR